jgi:hypothetical protein
MAPKIKALASRIAPTMPRRTKTPFTTSYALPTQARDGTVD